MNNDMSLFLDGGIFDAGQTVFDAGQVAVNAPVNISDATGAISAFTSGNYWYGIALLLVLIVALVRRYGGSRFPILASKKFAPILVLSGAFFAAMATGLAGSATMGFGVLIASLKVAVTAAGGYSIFKPFMETIEKHMPSWMRPVFKIVFSVFQSKEKAKVARNKRANSAGQKAEEEYSAEGVDIDFKDIE